MLIRKARKLLKKYDLFFDGNSKVTIINKNQSYYHSSIWCQRVCDEFELDEFIKERSKKCIWFTKKSWHLNH